MDGILLRKIVNFINKNYSPFGINGVYETSAGVELECFKDGLFYINFNFISGMIFFSKSASGAIKKLPFLSKGGFVKSVSQRGYDRIIEFETVSRKGSGKLEVFYVIGEFPGSNGNLFILNEQKKIIYSHSSNNIDKDRSIGVGKIYTYFKRNKVKNIDSVTRDDFSSFIELEGFYSPTANYCDGILAGRGLDNTLEIIKSLLVDEHLYVGSKGKVYPFKIDELCREVLISEFDDNIFSSKFDSISNERKKIIDFLDRKLSSNKKIIQKLEKELAEAIKYDEYRDMGELLKSNYDLIRNSCEEVTVLQYGAEGVVERKIDASKIQNTDAEIERLFSKYKKMKRSVEQIRKRMEDVGLVIKELEEELFNLEMADDGDVKNIYKFYFSKEKHIPKKDKNPFRIRMLTHEGVEILVGKNSRANHELVFHMAKGEDYWFHAKDYPSAHVVVRNVGGGLSEDVIIFAARITGGLSKGRTNLKIDVDYTQRKYVKKPKKTPEGFVIYSNFKTITVNPCSEDELIGLGL